MGDEKRSQKASLCFCSEAVSGLIHRAKISLGCNLRALLASFQTGEKYLGSDELL